jgi:hypothetical protein
MLSRIEVGFNQFMGGNRKKVDLADEEGLRYKMYLHERDVLIEGEQESTDQLDKNILALAGGALGISVVFMEKIAPNPLPETLVFLCWSWLGLALSLLMTLSSFLTSQHAYRRQIEILEAEIFPETGDTGGSKNCWSILTRILNWCSIISFIFGITMLAYFSIQNVRNRYSAPANQTKQAPVTETKK